jgi:hypothetical protein
MSADVTLTSSSNQVQNLYPNANFLSIILPDATTIVTPSSPRFIINNIGSIITTSSSYAYSLAVRRSDGSLICVVNAGGTAYIALENNSTSRGEWVATGQLLSWTNIMVASSGLPNDFGVNAPPIRLTNGKSIIVLASGFGGNETRLVYGSSAADFYYAFGTYVGLFQISSTQAILLTQQSTNLRSHIVDITDKTLTITASTVKTISSGISGGSVAQLTTSTYAIFMKIGTAIEGVVMTISSGVTAFGTQTTLKSGLTNPEIQPQGAVGYNSTTALLTYSDGSNPNFTINAFAVTVSGTTFTIGTTSVIRTGGNTAGPAPKAFMQNGSVLIAADDTQNSGACFGALTISGTTLTIGTFVNQSAVSFSGVIVPFAFTSARTFYKGWYTARNKGYCINVSGTTATIVYYQDNTSGSGWVEDFVNTRMIACTFPTFEQTTKFDTAASSAPVLYIANSNNVVTTAAQYSNGNIFGGYLDPIVVTSGGVLYGNRQYGNRLTNLKTMSLSGIFTENYGVSNNLASRTLPTASDDVNPAYCLTIGNFSLVRTAAKVTALVEMAL